jgi:hypothetical protein
MPHPLPLDIRLFEWVDHNGWAYWLAAWSIFALVLATALAPFIAETVRAPDRRPRWLRLLGSGPLFVVAVVLVFCAFRWPLWFAGPLDNPDEAEWIAGALTLRDGGLPWKSIDCHTSGPLNAATLLLTIPLGLPLDYVGVRALTSLLQAASALALWRAARRCFPEGIARLALLPAVNFWACRWHHDIGQYSSELTSVLLLALAGWSGAVALTTARPRLRLGLLTLAGALTTTAPLLAKPQAAPISLALGVLLLGAVCLAPDSNSPAQPSRRDRWRRVAALALGAVAPALTLGAYLWVYGLIQQCRIFYWQSNVLYTDGRTFGLGDSVAAFGAILHPVQGATACVLGVFTFGLLSAGVALRVPHPTRGHLIGAWLLVAAAIIAILAPGRIERRHYLHFLVLPLSWLAAVSLVGARDFLLTTVITPRRTAFALVGTFLLVTTAWPVWQTTRQCPAMNGQLYFWRERQTTVVGDYVRGLAEPGDKLVVWGWAPGYHVETGLGQGSREAHCGLIIDPGPLQSHYRDRLLFDLRRNQPRWFIDAVAPGQFAYKDRRLFGHESFPELKEFIATRYEFIEEFDGVRIFRRRDAIAGRP